MENDAVRVRFLINGFFDSNCVSVKAKREAKRGVEQVGNGSIVPLHDAQLDRTHDRLLAQLDQHAAILCRFRIASCQTLPRPDVAAFVSATSKQLLKFHHIISFKLPSTSASPIDPAVKEFTE